MARGRWAPPAEGEGSREGREANRHRPPQTAIQPGMPTPPTPPFRLIPGPAALGYSTSCPAMQRRRLLATDPGGSLLCPCTPPIRPLHCYCCTGCAVLWQLGLCCKCLRFGQVDQGGFAEYRCTHVRLLCLSLASFLHLSLLGFHPISIFQYRADIN